MVAAATGKLLTDGLGVAGGLISGVGGYQSGKYNRAADYAAATATEQDGANQEARVRATAAQAIGQQITAQGASGFQMGTGSALDDLAQSQVNATLDALNVRRKAAAQARAQRQQGEIAYATRKNALTAGLFGAAAKGVNFATDWASARAGQTPGGGYGWDTSAFADPTAGDPAAFSIDA